MRLHTRITDKRSTSIGPGYFVVRAAFAIAGLLVAISLISSTGSTSAVDTSAPLAPPCSVPSFGSATIFNVPRPRSLAVADFNGDNKLDIVAPNNLTLGGVRILLGDGNGGFTDNGNFLVGRSPVAVATADFNSDGKVDVIVANNNSSQVGEASLILGNGAGGFSSSTNLQWGPVTQSTMSLSIATADFNSDGKSDVVVTNTLSGNRVLTALGDGAGHFTSFQTIFTTGFTPIGIVAADLTADGKTDLAFANSGSHTVSVLSGDGTGQFGPATNFTVGTSPQSLASGDFSGDGKIDLATADSSKNVSVLINNGSGSFATAVSYSSGADRPRAITAGDFNSDGQTDLAVVSIDPQNLVILQNQGGGTFKSTAAFPVDTLIPTFIATADFNGDGRADLATAHEQIQRVSVFLNNCDSPAAPTLTFSESSITVFESFINAHLWVVRNGSLSGTATFQFASSDGTALSPGDYTSVGGTMTFADGEASKRIDFGVVDDVVNEAISETFAVALSNVTGNATLGSPASTTVFIFDDDSPSEISVANSFTPEGHAGMTTANFSVTLSAPSSFTITVDYMTANGSALSGTDYVSTNGLLTFAPGETSKTISVNVIGDTTGEINEAFFMNLANPSQATIGTAQAQGTILDDDSACPSPAFALSSTLNSGSNPLDIVAGDFNGDNKKDLVVANRLANNVSLFLSDGSGGFASPANFAVGMRPNSLGLGDFNNDGKLDVVSANYDGAGGASSISVLLGNGSGGFAPASTTSPVTSPQSVAVGDVNGDSRSDLAIVSSAPTMGLGSVSMLFGDGAGGFGAPTTYTAGQTSLFGTLVNLGGDNKPDVLVANQNSNDLTLRINNGDGTFAAPGSVSVGSAPQSVAVGDLNGDSKADVVAFGAFAPENITVLLGNGTGGFTSSVSFTLGSGSYRGRLVDLNGDGRLDLAVTNPATGIDSGSLWVLFGNGAGSFGTPTKYVLGEQPIAVDAADFNGDAKLDLAVANLNSNQISILLNNCANVPQTTFQFDSSSYVVHESIGSISVTVNRNGDTSGSATVAYQTTDADNFTVNCSNIAGSAFGRCDFATSVDTLTFAPGETSKTFAIPIINDAIAEGSETFGVTLSNATGGATLGAPATATATITDNDAVTGPNPIFTTPFFVRQHYLDFLSREPEAGEPWSAILNGCSDVNNNPACDRLTVSGAFFGSPEFSLKGLFVYRFYKLAFNRLPLYSEIVVDMRAVTGATPAETFQKKATFTNNFVVRTEFMNLFDAQTNTQYVNTLMGRYSLTSITTPDPAAPDGTNKVTLTTADLINRLNGVGGTLTRAQVLRAIADSDQVVTAESNQGFVAMQYYGYLRRTPDIDGFNSWINHLNANPTDFRTMVNGFMNSSEYRLRFGPPN